MGTIANWADRLVVVSGGTSGLGLQLVVAVSKQHAHVVIIGRDLQRLESARLLALQHGAKSAECFSIDLRVDSEQDAGAIRFRSWLANRNVDLLVNAVGRSDRGALEKLQSSELDSMFQDNVICVWNMTRICLDSLRRARGCITNIGSLAGLIAVPKMGAYSIAKFALTAMTRQLRLELAADGVHVMLVSPGPIRRDDSATRYQDLAAARGADAETAAPGGGADLKLIDPEVLCQKILSGAHARQSELAYPSKAKLLAAIAALWPSLADRILRRYLKKN